MARVQKRPGIPLNFPSVSSGTPPAGAKCDCSKAAVTRLRNDYREADTCKDGRCADAARRYVTNASGVSRPTSSFGSKDTQEMDREKRRQLLADRHQKLSVPLRPHPTPPVRRERPEPRR